MMIVFQAVVVLGLFLRIVQHTLPFIWGCRDALGLRCCSLRVLVWVSIYLAETPDTSWDDR